MLMALEDTLAFLVIDAVLKKLFHKFMLFGHRAELALVGAAVCNWAASL